LLAGGDKNDKNRRDIPYYSRSMICSTLPFATFSGSSEWVLPQITVGFQMVASQNGVYKTQQM
jgi:hypothetical protein